MKSGPDTIETVHVLHVDDQELWIQLAKSFLHNLSETIHVYGETDPKRALERLSSQAIDCVICDYQMPEMDGITFLEALRDTHPNLPVIFFTGKGSEAIECEATTAGATAYIEKGDAEVYEVLANQIERSVVEV